MDLRLFLSTFVTIFLVEVGDKTQLATFTLASQSQSRLSVFAGASLALAANAAIGVFAAKGVMHVIPIEWLRRAGGALFIVLGLFYLLRS